ncbi:MAG: hypothetical protein JRH20_15045 [Deltaproteobacteria bacterium]|nr:hypothetical protein [Deltaproteobacteria bacterium]
MECLVRFQLFSALGLAFMLGVPLTGCSPVVGDECTTNIECSATGDRICDTAQKGGYCTVQGCTPDSCPEEAHCISFYPTEFLERTCTPETEDAVDPALPATDDCLPDEFCLSSGFCAQRSLESRFCMARCDDGGDCRDGYECRTTGTLGAEAVIDPTRVERRVFKFCAQRP